MASLGLGWAGEPAFAHLLEKTNRATGLALTHGDADTISGLLTLAQAASE